MINKKLKKTIIKKEDIISDLNKFGKINYPVKNTFNFIETGFLDSINLLVFIEHIEKKYKINLSSEYINSKKFGDLKDLIKHINKILNSM